MFRNFLRTDIDLNRIDFSWVLRLGGLVRVAVFDSDPSSCKAFVIVYHEEKNQYKVVAFNINTGEIYWSENVANGGYGAPAVTDTAVILPTKFTDIVALSKEDGKEIWRCETSCRVRSPLNVVKDSLYFSSGGTIFELKDGAITDSWEYPGAFFYGSVDTVNDQIISLGAIDENGESAIKVFAFHRKGGTAYVIPISNAPVVSTDTSGICWRNEVGFIGGRDTVTCFDAQNGKILWSTQVEGFAGRQVCSVDDQRVYYMTQSGVVGALNVSDGSLAWSIKTRDAYIVSPISIANNHLLLLADACLSVLNTSNGQMVFKIPVGHSPYSMVSLKGDRGLLGSGEPPHNGLLFAFKINSQTHCEKLECTINTSNAFIESSFFDISIHINNAYGSVQSVQLDGSIFDIEKLLEGERVDSTTFVFRVPLPKTMNTGDYVIPLFIKMHEDRSVVKPILITLERKNTLPSRCILEFVPEVIQEKPRYSGAAIGAALKNFYGNQSTQEELREMVDFSLELSKYDAFQAWRINLRRILTSSANKTNQLPEFDSLNRSGR